MISDSAWKHLELFMPVDDAGVEKCRAFVESEGFSQFQQVIAAFMANAETTLIDSRNDEKTLRLAQGKHAALDELIEFVGECAYPQEDEYERDA